MPARARSENLMSDKRIVELVVADLGAERQTTDASLCILSAHERARANRFVLETARRRYVLARARLRRLLGARLQVRPQDLRLVTGRHGKPALGGRHAATGLQFNLSHSEDMVVYAFSWAGEVGVDIEALRPLRGADEIAAMMFSQRENAAYRALDRCHRLDGFFNCWTRKEAFVKALGSGFHHPLKRFDVSLAPGEPARILRVDGTPGAECGWEVREFAPAPGWVGAVVARLGPGGGQARDFRLQ